MANPINTFAVVKTLIAWGERAEKQGLNLSRDLQSSIDDPEQMMRIVECIVANSMAEQALRPVYDVRRVNALFSLDYSQEFLIAFGPPPDAQCGFLTFFDPGWDLLRVCKFCAEKDKLFFRGATQQDWYADKAFAKKSSEPRYRQIRLATIDDSFRKEFDEQRRLMPETEQVPSARVVMMGMVIHFLLSGQRLFDRYYVRCADKDRDLNGSRICVGYLSSGELDIDSCWDDYRRGNLGLASSRKF